MRKILTFLCDIIHNSKNWENYFQLTFPSPKISWKNSPEKTEKKISINMLINIICFSIVLLRRPSLNCVRKFFSQKSSHLKILVTKSLPFVRKFKNFSYLGTIHQIKIWGTKSEWVKGSLKQVSLDKKKPSSSFPPKTKLN